MVFGGGAKLKVLGDAQGLLRNLSRGFTGERAQAQGIPLPTGFVDVQTDSGVVYVNPLQVAYVQDDRQHESVLDKA
jgi:hypothetical protein